MKTTRKDIIELVTTGTALELTTANFEDIRKNEGWFKSIAYSCGVYGCTARLLQGANTNKLYAVTSRNNVMFMI